ncbi:MAG: hypothetical protein RL322_3256 [Pseudomonadota bacterium]|jgi:hypothetical protein
MLIRSWSRALAGLLIGFMSLTASAQEAAQRNLPVVELSAGLYRIRAELAATPASRSVGLMHRTELGPNQGMLFVFPERGMHCFWMRNTLIPLTIAFIADDGRIVSLSDMAPMTENGHCPAEPVRLALEMTHGWFGQKGIRVGSRIALPPLSAR